MTTPAPKDGARSAAGTAGSVRSAPAAAGAAEGVPLSTLAEGTMARLTGVKGDATLRSKLVAMGLRRHVRVRVMQNRGREAVVLAVGGTRVVLGRGVARKVMVEAAGAEGGHDTCK
jgi:ferrous iron transport protein A